MRVYIERVKEHVHKFWVENQKEIIESVSDEKQEKVRKEKNVAQKDPEEKRIVIAMLIPFVMGGIYVVVGSILLLLTINEKIYGLGAQDIIIGAELLILGIYALLYTALSYSEYRMWKEHRLKRVARQFLVFLMLPYHLCIKLIKGFIKDIRQEHVAYLFPYYLISAMFVMFTYIFIISIISKIEFDEMFNEVVAFGIVLVLLKEFFWLGEKFAYHITKSIIKSVQKAEIKKVSKINWRGTYKDTYHKKERKDKLTQEWGIVKEELEYSKIYFYIILIVLVLWIPKEDGSLQELLINQFLGITTIAALAREATLKKENSHN